MGKHSLLRHSEHIISNGSKGIMMGVERARLISTQRSGQWWRAELAVGECNTCLLRDKTRQDMGYILANWSCAFSIDLVQEGERALQGFRLVTKKMREIWTTEENGTLIIGARSMDVRQWALLCCLQWSGRGGSEKAEKAELCTGRAFVHDCLSGGRPTKLVGKLLLQEHLGKVGWR